MAAPNMQTAMLQNALLPAVLQSFLADICNKAVLAFVHNTCYAKGCCGTSIVTCAASCLHHCESRPSDSNSFVIKFCTTGSSSSDSYEENASEKSRATIIDEVPAPEVADKVSRQHFSEWLLMAKNKDDDDEEDDEDEDDDEDEEDEDGDDEDGDDDEGGGDGEGEAGEGDEDDEEDEADDDDDEDDEDEEDEDDEDESPPKKLKK